MTGAAPLAGAQVAIVHPAWHSCGTYQVVLGQVAAYRALGAAVMTIACGDVPGFAPGRAWAWRDFVAHTPELDAQPRAFAGVKLRRALRPSYLRNTLAPFLRGDQAAMLAGAAEAAALSPEAERARFDLVHCNHFFCMPVARRVAHGARIALDTHDLQASQFALIARSRRLVLRPRAAYEDMLARELQQMRGADALIHLNAEEERFFRERLPQAAHHLLYPAVPDVGVSQGGGDILLVSSRNAGNVESALWFLREVMPQAGDPPVRIVGSVDAGVRAADRALHARYKDRFVGRVDDPASFYRHARLVLLPTIAGTGLSIKTAEAMASGLPLIATRHAFRGMDFNPETLGNVTLADSPEEFARALREAAGPSRRPKPASPWLGDTRRTYDRHFSPDAYRAGLLRVVGPLVADRPGASVA